MQPQFITKPAFTVVGLRIQAEPMSPEIPNLWQQFGPRMNEVPHQVEPHVSYGVMSFDPQSGALDYMAGSPVEKVADLPTGMTPWDVPANTYAVFEATLPTLTQVFDHIHSTWLPTSIYQRATGPFFEFYSDTFNPNDPTSPVLIYIPVKKKA
ncbi:MAG: AraC family transcriptional regulator [Anaerolineae bacterium]|nr:AraC family transcriptional regulator [Anaerolineae bacterium]MCB0177735.1 AraC family transcriptional regulator [Anaerolineae bacterium]MCB9107745.1 AraC family transcriptional regulator [Anaerolineales bacterium]